MRRRDQRGATLILVLALVVFLLLLVPAVVGLAFTGSKLTPQVVRIDREEQYAATSALDAAILEAQQADWIGRSEKHGGVCPVHRVSVDSTSFEVTCEPRSVWCEDRTITFRALAEGEHQASATVLFAHREGGPVTQVLSWSSDPSRPVTPPEMLVCPPPDPLDDIAAITAWGTASTERSGDQWRAQAVLAVTGDVKHEPLVGAEITVHVEYRRRGEVWSSAGTLVGTTDDDGEWLVQSGFFPVVGSPADPVERIRFSVTRVTAGELGWTVVPERDVIEISAPTVATLASVSPLTAVSSGNAWHASGTVEVRNNAGDPVAGAVVQLQVRFRTDNNGWQNESVPLTTDATSASGTVPLASKQYPDNGKQGDRVREVELTILNVTAPGLVWSSGTWPGGALSNCRALAGVCLLD